MLKDIFEKILYETDDDTQDVINNTLNDNSIEVKGYKDNELVFNSKNNILKKMELNK